MRTLLPGARFVAAIVRAVALSAALALPAVLSLGSLASNAHAAAVPTPGAAAPLAMGVSDDAGGSIALFADVSSRLCVQRIDASGAVRWPLGGVRLPTADVVATGNAQRVVPDGAGGVVAAWIDDHTGVPLVYAQRVDVNGTRRWAPAGVALSAFPAAGLDLASDGAGGAFIAWTDTRGATETDVWVQHVSAAGVVLWPAGGVALASTADAERHPLVQADGAGGAIVAWTSGIVLPRTARAQRVDAAGTVQWAAGGVSVRGAAGTWLSAGDASGGLIALCVRDSGVGDVAQRITPAGDLPWGAGGVEVGHFVPFESAGEFPGIASDGSGGAIVTWTDFTVATAQHDLRALRVDAGGGRPWGPGGISITAGTPAMEALVAPDGAGGALVTWARNQDLFAQRLDAGGAAAWPAGGVTVCVDGEYQSLLALSADGAGGATITWNDRRHRTRTWGARVVRRASGRGLGPVCAARRLPGAGPVGARRAAGVRRNR